MNIEDSFCQFGPFQVVPYSHNDRATEFEYLIPLMKTLTHCFLAKSTKVKVKFPNNATEMKVEWLNGSYVNLAVSDNNLFFKVRELIAV